MDKYIYDENNGLRYERCGDYYLPYLVLSERKSIGKWGQKYRAYLRKHKRDGLQHLKNLDKVAFAAKLCYHKPQGDIVLFVS